MADVTLRVGFAGPLVTFQDGGRRGQLRYGVSASGPMDRLACQAANVALGNACDATAIEVSLGGLGLTCHGGAVTCAVAGGAFLLDHNGQRYASGQVLTLHEGDRLTIRPGRTGSWAYLTLAGSLRCPTWLGHSATHAISGLGGGVIATGQTIPVDDAALRRDREGAIAGCAVPADAPIRVVTGPQEDRFSGSALRHLLSSPFTVTDAHDRMGMRLEGPVLALDGALSIPSEPILRGSIQVSGDGVPTVLLADHQTTGGYPKIATVLSCDVDRLVQYRAGQPVRFAAVTPDEAIAIVRHDAQARAAFLARLGTARGTLEQRLMRENLVQGPTWE